MQAFLVSVAAALVIAVLAAAVLSNIGGFSSADMFQADENVRLDVD